MLNDSQIAQLHQLRDLFRPYHLCDLIHTPDRQGRYTYRTQGLTISLHNHWLTHDSTRQLINLAQNNNIWSAIHRLFDGEPVNFTTQRPALHTLARTPEEAISRSSLMPRWQTMQATLKRMAELTRAVSQRQPAIRDIIHIGTGGSVHATRTAYEALASVRRPGVRCHFISQLDSKPLDQLLPTLDANHTLVVAVSKTFTTEEVITNLAAINAWLDANLDATADKREHLYCVSAARERVLTQGYTDAQTFTVDDDIGGRFSLWTSVGLSLMLCIGEEHFRDLLAGAHHMDQHCRYTPLIDNIPCLTALLDVWYVEAWGVQTQAVISYAPELEGLASTLQQLWMESLGKSTDIHGQPRRPTGSVLFGGPATESQHTFHQHLHQSHQMIPVDIILPIQPNHPNADSHRRMIAHALGQSDCLTQGSTITEDEGYSKLNHHHQTRGNQPNTLILMHDITPHTLGELLAFYEHRVYIQSILLGINAFDQYGVDLGKSLAALYYQQIQHPSLTDHHHLSLVRNLLEPKSE